jgi:hypothetical protein
MESFADHVSARLAERTRYAPAGQNRALNARAARSWHVSEAPRRQDAFAAMSGNWAAEKGFEMRSLARFAVWTGMGGLFGVWVGLCFCVAMLLLSPETSFAQAFNALPLFPAMGALAASIFALGMVPGGSRD